MSDYHDCDSRDDCDAAREERDELKVEIGRLRHLLSIAKGHIDQTIHFTLIDAINKALEQTGGGDVQQERKVP